MRPCKLARVVAVAVAAMAALLASGAAAQAPSDGRGDPVVGEALAQRWCAQCHLVGDSARATDAAPTFASIARDPAKTASHLRAFLAKPHVPMPPLPLSGSEIDDLVAYIRRGGPGS